MAANGSADVTLLEWVIGGIVAVGTGAVGFLYRRFDVLSDNVAAQFAIMKADVERRHEDNQRRLQTYADETAKRQNEILMRLSAQPTRDDLREMEQRFRQQLRDLGLDKHG